ncbi:hypothetical protein KP509_29G024800 [Ceratopteris richardii]|nr:hypothetical protein KP509_29G024800 [Ceratopteris richardii]
MYAKCGLPEKAHYLLQEISYVDVYTWTALISSFVNQGQAYHALYCYGRLQNQGLYADAVTFSAILKACASIQDLEIGQQIHDQISKRDLLSNNVFLGTALIHMYVSCGALERAVQVLRELSVRDAIVWNTLLAGYVQHGDGHKALRGFEQMQQEGLYPNAGTFLCVMKACGIVGAIEKGKQLHHEIIRQGLLTSNPLLGKALVTMYAKCGLISKAQSVLEALPFQDKNLWSMLIIKYVEQGQGEEALKCFECMERKGIHMDAVAFICALKACGCVGAIEKGRELHMKISEQGLLKDNALLGTALLGMYIKCGDMDKARQVLDELFVRDVVVWSALIAGYAQVAQGDKALDCFDQMQYEGVSGNAVTFMAVLKACGVLGAIQKGEQIHDKIMELGLLQQSLALGNALADMYIKCGQVRKARQVLEDLPLRDEISWNILIAGYIEQGQDHKALNCLKQMEIEGLAPDPATFTCVLKACGSLGAVEQGKQIHDEIIRQGLLEKDVVLGTSLMDMYVKCGLFDRAQEVIEHLQGRDIISWSSLLAGYADSGDGENALNCFNEMQCRGLIPDAAAFSCMLNACAYSGLVKEAQALFTIMKTKFDIDPELRHYVSLIDLFGHFGHLDKATEVIQKLPDAELAAAWASLLALCQVWGNLNIGRWAFEHSIQKKE